MSFSHDAFLRRWARVLGWVTLAVSSVGCFQDSSGSSGSSGSGGSADGSSGVASTQSDGSSGGEATTGTTTGTSTGTSTGLPVGPCREVYVNYDGVTLTAGDDDDPALGVVVHEALAQTWSAYANDSDPSFFKAEAVLSDFNICLTRSRPLEGTYDMIVVSSDNSPIENNPFIALNASRTIDCGDAREAGDILLVTLGSSGLGEDVHGALIARAIGYTLGLALVDTDGGDIMDVAISAASASKTFVDNCSPIWEGNNSCPATPSCAGSGQQNSYVHLQSVLGLGPGS